MPYRDDVVLLRGSAPDTGCSAPNLAVHDSGWARTDRHDTLPVLSGRTVMLRALRRSDAHSLHALLSTEEVARFISPPPTTVEGFERFIDWTFTERAAGSYVCFAVTIRGYDTAIGIFQVRARDRDFGVAEWGFAIGSAFWGTGVFLESAELVLDFVFRTLGTHRLEARAAVRNGRGQGALLKLGAVQEGVLRRSLRRGDEVLDQALFTILEDEWRERGHAPQRSSHRPSAPYLIH